MPTTLTTAQRDADRARSRGWHERRRARGICGNAPCEKKPEINPRTDQPYWACRSCRRKIAARANQ